jgi:diguanylate cyclase (GGDEF)-like protein
MVARTLAGSLRNFDAIGRWGGEEFVALVFHVDGARLQRVAERSRALVAGSSLAVDEERLMLTVSIGGALLRPGETAEELLQRADRNMYRSKEAGRNRVTLELT